MRKVYKPYNHGGNHSGNRYSGSPVKIDDDLYKIFILLTEHHWSQKRVKKAFGYRSKSTISRKVKRLLKLGVIECINPNEKTKFYRAIPSIRILPTSTGEKGLTVARSGRVPEMDVWRERKIPRRDSKTGRFLPSRKKEDLEKRDFDSIAFDDEGVRKPVCRVHSKSFVAPVVDDDSPLNEIKWDKVTNPNNKFMQHDITWSVPGIGMCSFRWIKSKNISKVIVWLPEMYVYPHELETEDTILEEKAWSALRWFSKNALKLKKEKGVKGWRFAFGLLEVYRPTHYAYDAPKFVRELLDKKGAVKTTTSFGESWMDDSKKRGGEIEFSDRDEAVVYMNMPGYIEGNRKWIGSFEENFTSFLKIESERNELNEKRWNNQYVFNKSVNRFMDLQDKKNDFFMESITGKSFKPSDTVQMKIDTFIDDEKRKRMMYG